MARADVDRSEFGGDPTESRLTYEKWNPMNHVSEWKTPELVIHSGKGEFGTSQAQSADRLTPVRLPVGGWRRNR